MTVSISENRFWQECGYNHGDVVLKNSPELLGVETTNHCNLKCIMCPRGEPDLMRRSLGNMDNDLLEKLIDQTTFFNEPTCLQLYGEPLMAPDIWKKIAIVKKKAPNVGFSTNATLLNAENRKLLLESEIDTLIIAIDGASNTNGL